MRKSLIILLVVLAAGAGVLLYLSNPRGISLGGIEIGGSERSWLADRSLDFLEDLQFKDFDSASTYHLDETKQKRDIPELIRSRFGIKHEVLDITGYEVTEVDLDRSKTRARVRLMVHFRVLGDRAVRDNAEAQRDLEMLLYWFRQPNGQWTMELESSLR